MCGEMLRAAVFDAAIPSMITAAALAFPHRLLPRPMVAAPIGDASVPSIATLPLGLMARPGWHDWPSSRTALEHPRSVGIVCCARDEG